VDVAFDYKIWTFYGSALNDLFHSNSAFSEFYTADVHAKWPLCADQKKPEHEHS